MAKSFELPDLPVPSIYYVGLESYPSRYTFQLQKWNTEFLDSADISYTVVEPLQLAEQLDNKGEIQTGQVLDSVGRPYYAMQQIGTLLSYLKRGMFNNMSVIFFEDMFHPGIESLFYALDQVTDPNKLPRIYMRCLAQTLDPDDFVHVTGMSGWMRKYEEMVLASKHVKGILCASQDMLMHFNIAGHYSTTARFTVTGLPFGKREVQSRQASIPWAERKNQVVFAARTDQEKQPQFFLALARRAHLYCTEHHLPLITFKFLSGKGLVGNNPDDIRAIEDAIAAGYVEFEGNLSKDAYYKELASSKVLFNCALQDWVSNTVSEADALGTNVLYPAYRSFIEVFSSDPERLYVPWSCEDAFSKLLKLLEAPHPRVGCISETQDASIENTFHWILSDLYGTSVDQHPGELHTFRPDQVRSTWNN